MSESRHGERVFFDLYHSLLMEIKENRGEYCSRGANIVLMGECGPFHLAPEQLENTLKHLIDYERTLFTILELFEFDLRLFGAW